MTSQNVHDELLFQKLVPGEESKPWAPSTGIRGCYYYGPEVEPLSYIPIIPGSVTISYHGVEISRDQGDGKLYTLCTGTINYATGQFLNLGIGDETLGLKFGKEFEGLRISYLYDIGISDRTDNGQPIYAFQHVLKAGLSCPTCENPRLVRVTATTGWKGWLFTAKILSDSVIVSYCPFCGLKLPL